jgi:hypothetical protein
MGPAFYAWRLTEYLYQGQKEKRCQAAENKAVPDMGSK